jgi:hypothetical protein
MKSFLQFLKEETPQSLTPDELKTEAERLKITPDELNRRIGEANKTNSFLTPTSTPEILKPQSANVPSTGRTPAAFGSIRGMSDQEAATAEARGRQQEAQQRAEQTRQNIMAADPTAGTIAFGHGGQGGGLNDVLPMALGGAAVGSLGTVGKVAQTAQKISSPVETAIGMVSNPLTSRLGPVTSDLANAAIKQGVGGIVKPS